MQPTPSVQVDWRALQPLLDPEKITPSAISEFLGEASRQVPLVDFLPHSILNHRQCESIFKLLFTYISDGVRSGRLQELVWAWHQGRVLRKEELGYWLCQAESLLTVPGRIAYFGTLGCFFNGADRTRTQRQLLAERSSLLLAARDYIVREELHQPSSQAVASGLPYALVPTRPLASWEHPFVYNSLRAADWGRNSFKPIESDKPSLQPAFTIRHTLHAMNLVDAQPWTVGVDRFTS